MFKRILRIIGKIVLIFISLIFVLLRSGAIYSGFKDSDKQLLKKLQTIDPNAKILYHMSPKGYTLRYAELGVSGADTVMLIYGTPGNILDWENVLTQTDILKKYHVIIPDRPGFGRSMKGHAMTNIQEQGDLLAELLPLSGSGNKMTLVGRSYAGALIPYIAATNTGTVKSTVVIAGTMDPASQTIWLITYPLHYTPLRRIIPSMLRVTDAEKLASEKQLDTIMPLRENIIAPTYLLHGKKDWIVQPANSLFAQKMLKNAKVFYESIEGIGHEIPIAMPEKVYSAIKTVDTYSGNK